VVLSLPVNVRSTVGVAVREALCSRLDVPSIVPLPLRLEVRGAVGVDVREVNVVL
jgi:hypothetical protein